MKRAGMMEWQTWTPQKRLLERACGFESRSRHTADADRFSGRLVFAAGTVSADPDNEPHVPPPYRGPGLIAVQSRRPGPGKRTDLRRFHSHHPALATRQPARPSQSPAALPTLRWEIARRRRIRLSARPLSG